MKEHIQPNPSIFPEQHREYILMSSSEAGQALRPRGRGTESAAGVAMAMDEDALSCLLRSRRELEQDIKASYLIDHMVSDGVLSGDEEERIRSKVRGAQHGATDPPMVHRQPQQYGCV